MPKEKLKNSEISISLSKGNFSLFRKPSSAKEYPRLKDVSDLRRLLGKEKARILHTLRSENPSSIYELSGILGRNFRAVREDVLLLKKFGLLELKAEQTKKRKRLRPVLIADSLTINLKL